MLRQFVLVLCLMGCSESPGPSDAEDAAPGSRPDAGPIFTGCEPGEGQWWEKVNEVYESLASSCHVDTDCVLAPDHLDCLPGGAYVGGCGRAVSVEEVDEFNSGIASAAATLCVEIDPECRSVPLCVHTRAVCRSGACTSE